MYRLNLIAIVTAFVLIGKASAEETPEDKLRRLFPQSSEASSVPAPTGSSARSRISTISYASFEKTLEPVNLTASEEMSKFVEGSTRRNVGVYFRGLEYAVELSQLNVLSKNSTVLHRFALDLIARRQNGDGIAFERNAFRKFRHYLSAPEKTRGLAIDESEANAEAMAYASILPLNFKTEFIVNPDGFEQAFGSNLGRLAKDMENRGYLDFPLWEDKHSLLTFILRNDSEFPLEINTFEFPQFQKAFQFARRQDSASGPALSLEDSYKWARKIADDHLPVELIMEAYNQYYPKLTAPLSQSGLALDSGAARTRALKLASVYFDPSLLEHQLQKLRDRGIIEKLFADIKENFGLAFEMNDIKARLDLWESISPLDAERVLKSYRTSFQWFVMVHGPHVDPNRAHEWVWEQITDARGAFFDVSDHFGKHSLQEKLPRPKLLVRIKHSYQRAQLCISALVNRKVAKFKAKLNRWKDNNDSAE